MLEMQHASIWLSKYSFHSAFLQITYVPTEGLSRFGHHTDNQGAGIHHNEYEGQSFGLGEFPGSFGLGTNQSRYSLG